MFRFLYYGRLTLNKGLSTDSAWGKTASELMVKRSETPFHCSRRTKARYMRILNTRSPLSIRIIILTFRDKHEQRSTQNIRMESRRSKQKTVSTLLNWLRVLEHTILE